ncbi:MAG: hypothetical protein GX444_18010 [Myxococcales bacterium]|nr:hypothetical protein [Myxococcales bacterium]
MKAKWWLIGGLVSLLFFAAACGEEEPGDFDAAPSGQTAAAPDALTDLDQYLNADGAPTRRSMIGLWRWIDKMSDWADREADDEYEFTPEEMHEIANLGVGLPPEEAWKVIHAELLRRHPGKIKAVPRWTFNSAGTSFCELALVYASLKEYVAFFGTPIGADGFSGRYNKSDVWDLMVDGEMWNYSPGEFQPVISLAGDMAYLPAGTGKGVQYVDHAWMIDYARGNIPSMFIFGVIGPALFVTMDYQSAWEQIVDFAELLFQNWFPS